MKQVVALFVIIFIFVFLSSCTLEGENMILIDNDQKIANEKFEEILEAIKLENHEMLISLFAKETLDSVTGFNQTITELFDYYNGEVELYDDWGGPYVETSKESDEIIQIMVSTYDVKTTEGEYRFAVKYVHKDTTNIDNIGVQSLYIIKKEDDTHLEYAYWGDGKNTPGINIAIPNAE